MRIGILGGTGPAGRALALRLAAAGHDVVVGSRSPARAAETRDELLARWGNWPLSIEPGDNTDAAKAELVVVATPWDGVLDTLHPMADELSEKVVISMANALVRANGQFLPLVPPRGSVAASIQAAVPNCLVVAAMHHLPARELGMLDRPLDSDVLVCSDHPSATAHATDILHGIPGVRVLDAGGLSNALPIEAFTAVLLQLNARYQSRAALRITGLRFDSAAPSLPAHIAGEGQSACDAS